MVEIPGRVSNSLRVLPLVSKSKPWIVERPKTQRCYQSQSWSAWCYDSDYQATPRRGFWNETTQSSSMQNSRAGSRSRHRLLGGAFFTGQYRILWLEPANRHQNEVAARRLVGVAYYVTCAKSLIPSAKRNPTICSSVCSCPGFNSKARSICFRAAARRPWRMAIVPSWNAPSAIPDASN